MSDSNGKSNIFVRVAVIAGMLLILFFIAAAIVKYVPRMISAMSPANVSLTSLFNPGESATSTGTSGESQPSPASASATSSAPAPAPAPTPAPTPNQPQTGGGYVYTYPAYSGPADLSISLVKVGQIMSDGSYVETRSLNPGARVQVQFNISNVGSGRSGNWTLNAVLPTSIGSEHIYNSQTQPQLNPGNSYLMTLAFDAYDPSQQAIQISIVGGNDANQGNNVLVIPVTSSGNYNYNNQNSGCYWSNGYYYCNNQNYNNNQGCYYSNGSYICNNNYNYNNNSGQNICYGTNNIPYYCNNTSNNNCYWSNGYYYCGGTSNADLSVTITNVGTMDRNTGQFIYTNSYGRNDRIAVQFEVRNLGGATSGNWTFSASLPSSSGSYTSGTQSSISGSQTTNYTVSFDNPSAGSQTLSIQLYPSGSDSNSSNNYASRQIQINN